MTSKEAIVYLKWIRPVRPYSLDKIKVQESIDLAIKALEDKSYAMGYQDGLEDGLDGIRPQGEWEKPFEMNGKTYHKCNYCHISSQLILLDKFCPNCGAKMVNGGTK